MDSGTLLAYFIERDQARKALRALQGRGYPRAVLISKNTAGIVHTRDSFPSRRLLWIGLMAALFASLAGAISVTWWPPARVISGGMAFLLSLLIGASAGALFGLLSMRRSRYGVPHKLIDEQAHLLSPDETALIVQVPAGSLRPPLAVLRESGELPPATFALHPERQGPNGARQTPWSLMSMSQIQAYARRLAEDHRLTPAARQDGRLLRRLEQARVWIHLACADLSEASQLEESTAPVAEWLLDNEHVIESNVRDIQLNLPRKYYDELPTLAGDQYQGLPRIYGLARELAAHTDLRLDRDNITAFIEAYQVAQPLTIGELWAVPQMLRSALIESIRDLATGALKEMREREVADYWANRLISTSRREPNQLFSVLAQLAGAQPKPSPYFASQLIDHLYDEEAALAPVRGWLERSYRSPLSEINLREQNRQTKNQLSIGNAFTSLRQLALLDWRELFESLNRVEQVLQRDPAGVYASMDFDTRNRYRAAVEELAHRSKWTEAQIAERVVQLASAGTRRDRPDERWSHVGMYLVGDGRAELVDLLDCRELPRRRLIRWLDRYHTATYLGGLAVISALFLALIYRLGLGAQPPAIQALIGAAALLPVSQLALELLNYLIVRILPPRTLPKMDFELSGIPDAYRTLVVVPILLTDTETVHAEVEKLEIRYLANREDNLLFSIFSDFTDSDQAHELGDLKLLQSIQESLAVLNRRYEGGRFFLFHRERTWSESEQKFIGWERKRGKLEELNRLIAGLRPPDAPPLVQVGEPQELFNVRFVITLDSDTQLPVGSARRLVETLSHPLNQPRFDGAGKIQKGTYGIIQPRVSPSLPSTSASPFGRLFADAVGIDPYTKAVSDVNQDLTGEGSYHGKGIYDVRAFNRVLANRFPTEWLLSHDLIEGGHVRVGLASDIELYDEFPKGYLSYAARQHRWIRGDWQIVDWIWPRVPLANGARGPNELSGFNRWKIFDNLRRSLVPAGDLALLIACWLISAPLGWTAAGLVALQLLLQPLVEFSAWLTSAWTGGKFAFWKTAHDLLQSVVRAALLPYEAGLALDAVLRVWYRRRISHHHLLEWAPAHAFLNLPDRLPTFLISMSLGSIFSLVVARAVWRWMPSNLWVAAPWLGLWLLSPLIGWLLNISPGLERRSARLTGRDLRFLRQVARRTWRYFADFVSDDTFWLPPDNYQVSHQDRLALRTSPTNIGLWMISALAAHEFGYLTPDQVIERLTRTMSTLGRLERHEGHLLNWYDLESLTPLEPRYVSSVDSGNLLGSLWALEHGLRELISRPLLEENALAGLRDTLEVLKRAITEDHVTGLDARRLAELQQAAENPPARLIDLLQLLRRLDTGLKSFADQARELAFVETGAAYWARQLERQLSDWLQIADRYLGWVEILASRTQAELAPLGPEAMLAIGRALERAPALLDIAHGNVAAITLLESIRREGGLSEPALSEWLDTLLEAFSKSKWLAGENLGLAERLIKDAADLSTSINMRFLYDPERRLFSIGYNVSEARLDNAFYDLLASEARLASFIAIARGDVPIEHWFSMSRPYAAVGRRRVLMSWTGSMFEYLMPLIFQRSYTNSLLAKAAQDAVEIHIAYGREQGVPWGISESAFADLDLNRTYQYKASGVPELGLKRGLEEELVVAPYATLLAVRQAAPEAVQNLKKLAGMGLLNEYGFYEAMDFGRSARRPDERGAVVRAYMAHHQGMGFLALTNFLHQDFIQRNFHADPRVRAVEPLLQERVPVLPPHHYLSMREGLPSPRSVGGVAPSVSKFDTPHTNTPKTQLLSNGRYSVMLTNSGGGYSHWGEQEITRWRSDRTRDPWGTFCYLREAEADHTWSTTYQPTGGKLESYSVNFALDRAVFQRTDNGIQIRTEVVVSPEDDVEIRHMTLINRSLFIRRLDLTSYVELAMAPHEADRLHPAFNKMFIQTEAVPESHALLAYRRPRNPEDPPIYVAHRFTMEGSADQPLQFETDRRRFIGRGRTLAAPAAVYQAPRQTEGFVLDPILSLRQTMTLNPGERVQISMIIAAGETREHVLRLMGKYGDPRTIERAMDFAWAAAQLELRLLRIQPDDARRFQGLASHLLFPNPLWRPPAERIQENHKGQSGLWPYGISGDLPIALVTIGEAQDMGLVRQLLQAHTYWRMHGLKADLVIIDEEASAYEQPLRELLESQIQAHSMHTGIDQPGGIFLRSADKIPPEDMTLLTAAAQLVVVAARGTLPQQLGLPVEVPEMPEPLTTRRPSRELSAALPFMQLPYFNSLGGFTPDGREYAIYLGPGASTPAPWVNVIANPSFGTLVSETGSGFTWYGNSQRNRLTEWSNDPVIDPPGEAIYIRDEETGQFWTPTPAPVREDSAYRARHGAGYTVFEHNSHGIEQTLTVFVPMNEEGGQSVKLQRLQLKNDSGRTRRLSVTYYAEWTLGESREASQMHIVTRWDEQAEALIALNRYHADYGDRVAFAAIDPPAESYSADRASFIGRNRSLSNPAGMARARRSGRVGAGLDPCAAQQVSLNLAPGESVLLTCMLGQAETLDEVRKQVSAYRHGTVTENALHETQAWWDGLLGGIEVHTPELSVDFLVNRWLLYQTLSCRLWARSAFYQSGGAFGFRDQLQDVLALLYTRPDLARRHILLAASRQFKEGDVQHWWHLPGGAGIRSRISDDMLWLPYVVSRYVQSSGDREILQAKVPFLDAPPLEPDQRELYLTPQMTAGTATLFEHCRRAVARSSGRGPHGLPLIGAGDWNDGMNLVGPGGKGESVWLGWFLVDVLQGMAELCGPAGQPALAEGYLRDRATLIDSIERSAWDGQWYRRAIFDDGTPIGSLTNAEAKIDSLPQSWAWLSGAARPERAEQAIESAWRDLVRTDEGLVLLFTPPFERSDPSPGYIQAYPPGVRENGGQYTHAAAWLAMAMARRGQGSRAAQILRIINPIEKAREEQGIWRYGIEPYVIAGDVYELAGHVGQGGWSWYTGSAGWIYQAWVEEILGLKVRGDVLQVDPVIPGTWQGFQILYRYGEAVYEIQVENPDGVERGVAWVELDGERLADGVIRLQRDLVKHRVLVRMGRTAPE
jgi:cyclic beta-1,2-glucan synthetase